MRQTLIVSALVLGFLNFSSSAQQATLDIYWIDVEGGAATLIVTPEREAVLMDAGWDREDARDANRIQAAMQGTRVSTRSTTSSLRTFTAITSAVYRRSRHAYRSANLSITATAWNWTAQVVGDELLQSEAFIQLADQNQPRVRRDMRSLERDLQQAVECELKRTVFFFTHQVSPSVVRLLASEPCKLRTRRLIRWVRYHGEIGNPGLYIT